MASNSYYGDSGANYQQGYQQQQVGGAQGYNQNQSYGASYGQSSPSYNQHQQGSSQYGGNQVGYSGQGQAPPNQTYAQQTYPDGSREQKYDAQGNPVLPNGERGLLTDLAGAAGGAYFGHKAGGHGFLGAIAGGIGAHLLGDAMGKKNHNKPHKYGNQAGGYGGGGGMMGGMFGRRDIDGSPDDGAQGPYSPVVNNQQTYQPENQYSVPPQQFAGQQGNYASSQGPDQAYGQNYGQNYGR